MSTRLSHHPFSCACREHTVQFYESDAFFTEIVGEYLRQALSDGHNALVIATPEHRQLLERHLRDSGVPVERVRSEGRYVALDAAECLAGFMRDEPDEVLFRQQIVPWLQRLTQSGELHAFGEMVALLTAQGRVEAALQLEECWNRLAAEHDFALCCAYPMQQFADERARPVFERICRAHHRVFPTERFDATSSPDKQLRETAMLQQQAAALGREIRERRRAEEVARRSEVELRAFVDEAAIGLHWVNAAGTIIWANAADYELLGYTRDEYVGQSIVRFHADPAVPAAIVERVMRGERVRDFEATLLAKDGTMRVVLIDSSGFVQDGQFRHTQCFTRDVTAARQAERELLAARAQLEAVNRELEERVQARTAALQAAYAELEQFSATISHDLRAPLRSMQVYCGALLEDHLPRLPSDAQHCLRRIDAGSRRMDKMIADVLAYSRIGREELPLGPVELDALVRLLVAETPMLNPPRAHVAVASLLPVQAHPAAVQQIVANLLSNACKFVAPGVVPHVRVWTERRPDGVHLMIADNGVGVAAELRPRLFGIFERLHAGSGYEGTGLGLAIVRRAAQRLGGDVGLEPRPEGGSLAWVRLKAA